MKHFPNVRNELNETTALLQTPTQARDGHTRDGHARDDSARDRSALFGYLLISLAACSLGTYAFLIHIAELYLAITPSVALVIISWTTFLLSLASLCTLGVFKQTKLNPSLLGRLLARGILAGCSLYCNNIAFAHIPIGTALTLTATMPVIASTIAAVFLRDPMSLIDGVILFVNMSGVVLVSQAVQSGGGDQAIVGVLAALGSALTAATGFTIVKSMGMRVHFLLNPLVNGACAIVISLFLTDWDELAMLKTNWRGAVVTMLASCLCFASQALVNCGMQVCRPGPALVVRSLNVPVSFVLALLFLGEKISAVGLLGVVLVLASACYLGINQMMKEQVVAREPVSNKNTVT